VTIGKQLVVDNATKRETGNRSRSAFSTLFNSARDIIPEISLSDDWRKVERPLPNKRMMAHF
jgi:hypothetical protein